MLGWRRRDRDDDGPVGRHGEPVTDQLAALLDQLEPELYRQVFMHSSWTERRIESYERLAFLGDSVLGLAVSTEIYPRYETLTAGDLTKVRAQAVSGSACARVAEQLEVRRRLTELAPPDPKIALDDLFAGQRVLASVCEAIIGACYLQFGFRRTSEAIVEAFEAEIVRGHANPGDAKTDLQEKLARHGDKPDYVHTGQSGPAHDRHFECVVEIRGERYGKGSGRSKKEAEQAAAETTLVLLAAKPKRRR